MSAGPSPNEGGSLASENELPLGLYVHIPFCRHRCNYCDFNTYVGLHDLYEPYVRALQLEIVHRAEARPAGTIPAESTTLFFGGGTPSLLNPGWLGDVIRTCRSSFGLKQQSEVTVECNPGTVDEAYLSALREQGVNRLSFGAQSSNYGELKLLGREHTFVDVAAAMHAARQAGFDNLNLDLIFGLPDQQLSTWQITLNDVLALGPDHISLYALTIEQGTPMYDWVRRGDVPYPDPDAAADMYDCAGQTLQQAGFMHYEISNWCKPGLACAHNLIYWRNEPYHGFGAGAHSSNIHHRWWNVLRPAVYIERVQHGESAEMGHEEIDDRTSRGETMMLGLRLLQEGVNRVRFACRYGAPVEHFYAAELQAGQARGLLELSHEFVRLTARGYFLSNQVLSTFV